MCDACSHNKNGKIDSPLGLEEIGHMTSQILHAASPLFECCGQSGFQHCNVDGLGDLASHMQICRFLVRILLCHELTQWP